MSPAMLNLLLLLAGAARCSGSASTCADEGKPTGSVLLQAVTRSQEVVDDFEAITPEKCCSRDKPNGGCVCKLLGCCGRGRAECYREVCSPAMPSTTTTTTTSSTTGAPIKCHVMYLMADNNLDGAIASDLEEVIANTAAVSSPLYYPLVFIDRDANGKTDAITGLKAADGITAAEFHSGSRYIEKDFDKNVLRVNQTLEEQNSDDPSTLTAFLTWAFARCKAKDANAEVMLTFGSHGKGWKGFGGDDSESPHLLQESSMDKKGSSQRSVHKHIRNGQIRTAIEESMAKASPPFTKLALLGFDACNMASYSSMQLYEGLSSWYLASQAIEPGHGWDYAALDPSLSVRDMAVKIIDGFAYGLHGFNSHSTPKTLAVFSSDDFSSFRKEMDELAGHMKSMAETPTSLALIAQVRADTLFLGGDDIGSFLKHFNEACSSAACGKDVLEAIHAAQNAYEAMLAGGHVALGPGTEQLATGMYIWFPKNDPEDELTQSWFDGSNGFTASGDRPWNQFLLEYWRLDHCQDQEGTAKDTYNTGCRPYTGRPGWCGKYDDHDFSANTMCCFCAKQ